MKFRIDGDSRQLVLEEGGTERAMPLYSREALRLVSDLWLKLEWNLNHYQSLSWLGFPIFQLPEDMVRVQEVLFDLRPSLIIETGVKWGGSSIFFASLCQLLGVGRVVSVDITIPPDVSARIATHPLGSRISLIQGDSAAPEVVAEVRRHVRPDDTVFVFLDSDHSKAHVTRELEAYAPLVTVGSYIVATDGIMQSLHDTPGGKPEWDRDNPSAAAIEFAQRHADFSLARPKAPFNDQAVIDNLTYFPSGWLKRIH